MPGMPSRAAIVPFEGNDGQYYFRVRAANGEVVAVSEGYTREEDVYRAIRSFRRVVFSAKTAALVPADTKDA